MGLKSSFVRFLANHMFNERNPMSRGGQYCYKCRAPLQPNSLLCAYCGATQAKPKQAELRPEQRRVLLSDNFAHRSLSRWTQNLGEWETRNGKLLGRNGTHYYGLTHSFSFDSRKEYTFRIEAQTRGATLCLGFINPSLDYGLYVFFHGEGHFDGNLECRFWRGGDAYDFVVPRHDVNHSFAGMRKYALAVRQGKIRLTVDGKFIEVIDASQLMTGRYLFSLSNYNPPTNRGRVAEHQYARFQVTTP